MHSGKKLVSAIMAVVLTVGLCPAPAFAAPELTTAASAPLTAANVTTSNSFKVTYIANGGKGAMKPQAIKRGKKTALRANAFTRSGYKFAGWNTKANGKGKAYKNKVKVKNLAKAGKTVKLYAQWKKAKVSYLSAYKPVLSDAISRKGEFSIFSGGPDSYDIRQYALWDINKDGTKELIAHVGFGGAGWNTVFVFTVKNGKAKLAGSFVPGYGYAIVSSKGKLYIYLTQGGYNRYSLVGLKGTQATEKVVFEEQPSTSSSYGKKTKTFEKKMGLDGKNALLWSDISDVGLLKGKTKRARTIWEYRSVLQRARAGQGEFAEAYATGDKTYWDSYCTYRIFDIGADGVPELIVRTGTNTANQYDYVFSIKSGKAVYWGKYHCEQAGLYGNAKGKLFMAGYHGGYYWIDAIQHKGGSMKTTRLDSGTSWDYDAVFDHADSFLMKKYEANSLGASVQAADYSLLQKLVK